uniref:Transmembrane protein 163-like n=1 Tax=Pundamilia nyererei TaxID=303518 RepID=A0A3B4FS16_9CICH
MDRLTVNNIWCSSTHPVFLPSPQPVTADGPTKKERVVLVTEFMCLTAGLLESSMRLKPHEAQNYRKKALWVSWLSIVVTLILAVAAFKNSTVMVNSSFGFFDATLDVMSSAIVLWRYSNAAAVHSAHREYIACVVLGVVFVLSSICILGKAIHDLATRMPPKVDDFLFSVSIVSGLTCAVLAVAKFMLGRVLTSRALITDGFNSLVGAIMGFSILISAEVFKHHTDVWFLDATIGVLMGLIILAYGVKLLKDMVPRVRQTRNYERFE